MMKLPVKIILLLWLVSGRLLAQPMQQLNSAEILLALQKLNTVGSVLYIAAHPDDENTRLLAWLANEKKLRTGYLSITRGDGGQNLVGKEQGDLLGLIRTEELLAARKNDGAEQFFTRAVDFGYSKTPEETFSFWNKDSVLGDVVWVIRNFKPDVIICRFPTTGEGGHGHHTASAILAAEAFEAAADPKRYPQQLAYAGVWQAKRLFWNTFNFSSGNTTSPDQVQVDVGVFNPLLGKSYGEIAAESRSMHKSQGFGSAKTRGKMIEYFKQLKGDSVRSLFEGLDFSWNRINGGQEISKRIETCIKNFNPLKPETIVPDLTEIYKKINALLSTSNLEPFDKLRAGPQTSNFFLSQKLKEVQSLLLSCTGLWLEADASDYMAVPGDNVGISVQAVMRNPSTVRLNKITFFNQTDTLPNLSLQLNELTTFRHTEKLPVTASYSNPYWLNEKHGPGMYTVHDLALIGKPQKLIDALVVFDIEIAGLPLKITQELSYKYTDPVKGEIYRPFEIVPPATVNISEKVLVFGDKTPKTIQFTVKAHQPGITGEIEASTSDGWKLQIQNAGFRLGEKGDEAVVEAILSPFLSAGEGTLKVSLALHRPDGSKEIITRSITRIEHDHIPYRFILSDAEARLVRFDLKKTGTNIGYILGAGDEVMACLKQAGYRVTVLTDEMLAHDTLSAYDAIVTGVRAYNTNERLQACYPKLMDYVKNGGNLVVQYNTNNRIGPVIAKIAPCPFTISRDRVTDEHAEVRFVNANHPVLNYPNKITTSDFDGWIQERGIYFAGERDSAYQVVLSMNDKGEKPLEGSLITAKYGRGNFVYTGLVFFRELPAGVPGAYRLFANLLSLPKN